MSEVKKKLCYILPSYNPDTDTHYAYLYPFINKISKQLRVFLVIEKGNRDVSAFRNCESVYIQKFSILPLRIFESFLVVLFVRFLGYKNFYTHYSFIGAFNSVLVTNFLGGRALYWNCGMPWKYKREFVSEWLFKFILKNSELVTGTMSLQNSYIDIYRLNKTKTHVMSNWIDTKEVSEQILDKNEARIKLKLPTDKKIILFIHHLSERKGAHRLVEIIKSLNNTNDYQLLVVGDGPYKEKLTKEIETEKTRNISIIGSVPHKDLYNYYSASDVFLMPSDEEGFPHVLLEAALFGVPYIASRVGGVSDITPQVAQKYLVEPDDVLGFASRISSASEDTEIKSELRSHVGRYDIENVAKEFIRLF